MTIHHDKLAYGKLKGLSDELSDEDIFVMLDKLEQDGGDNESTGEVATEPAQKTDK